MKKSALFIVGLFFSVTASAANPDYSILAQSAMNPKHFQQCLYKMWMAVSPTDAQIDNAMPFFRKAKNSWVQSRDGITKDSKDLIRAWSAYPISTSDIEKIEIALHDKIIPVHIGIRDNTIAILNLLTAEQRKAFDRSLFNCIGSRDVF
jgi:hypothetical protein